MTPSLNLAHGLAERGAGARDGARKLLVTPPLASDSGARDDGPRRSVPLLANSVAVDSPRWLLPTAMHEAVTQPHARAASLAGVPAGAGTADQRPRRPVPLVDRTRSCVAARLRPDGRTPSSRRRRRRRARPCSCAEGAPGWPVSMPSRSTSRPREASRGDPTAMQNEVPTQRHSSRSSAPVEAGFATTAQTTPFHCSTRVPPPAPLFCPRPPRRRSRSCTRRRSAVRMPGAADGALPSSRSSRRPSVGTVMAPTAETRCRRHPDAERPTRAPAVTDSQDRTVRRIPPPCSVRALIPAAESTRPHDACRGSGRTSRPAFASGGRHHHQLPAVELERAAAPGAERDVVETRRLAATRPTRAASAAGRSRTHGGRHRAGARCAQSPSGPDAGRRSRPRPWCRHRAGRPRRRVPG